MVLWHLLRAARRQLVLTLIGSALTVAACLVAHSQQGLYQATITVVLLRPDAGTSRHPFIGRDSSLIATASSIAKIVDSGTSSARTASPEVTLAAQGHRHGWTVNVPNAGGQWTYRYDKPELDIQAVGSTEAEALDAVTTARSAISRALTDLEDREGVDPRYRIVLSTNPQEPLLTYGAGRPTRALGATLVLGLGATLTAAVWLDDLRSSDSEGAWRTPARIRALASRWRRLLPRDST